MLATQLDNGGNFFGCNRPKRLRNDGAKHYDFNGSGPRCLELQDVIRVTKQYEDSDGGMNCSLCGKLYKSKVCFIKHIWEHTVYWDLFDGSKNHDRVLSIQAALILHSGHGGIAIGNNKTLSNLLVTNPGNLERKTLSPDKHKLSLERKNVSPEKMNLSPERRKLLSERKGSVERTKDLLCKPEKRIPKSSPLKRKRSD